MLISLEESKPVLCENLVLKPYFDVIDNKDKISIDVSTTATGQLLVHDPFSLCTTHIDEYRMNLCISNSSECSTQVPLRHDSKHLTIVAAKHIHNSYNAQTHFQFNIIVCQLYTVNITDWECNIICQ